MSSNHIGDYELTGVIGRGATGRVWRGHHRTTGSEVAVKVLRSEYADDPEARARFLVEARLLVGRTLPGIVCVHEGIDEAEAPAIVMDLVPGPTLRQLVNDTRLSLQRATRLTYQLAIALGGAHAMGLVHGDVKPENILIRGSGTADEEAVLTDFGLARVLEESASSQTRSQVIGTPHYAAPEIHSGGKCRPPADVYSLGIILYELVAGRRPFQAPHTSAVIEKHLNADPEPTDDFSQALWDVVVHCLAKDPASRPTAETLTTQLQSIIDNDLFAVEALPTTTWKSTQPATEPNPAERRHRLRWMAASLVLLAALGTGSAFAYMRFHSDARAGHPSDTDSMAAARADQSAPAAADRAATSTATTAASTTASTSPAPSAGASSASPSQEAALPAAPDSPGIDGDSATGDGATEPDAGTEAAPPSGGAGGGSGSAKRKVQTTPDPIPPPAPPAAPKAPSGADVPLGAQRSTRTAKLSDGRVLEVELYWNRTATLNDWTKVRYRVTGSSRPYAVNVGLYESGNRVYFAGFDAVPGGSWYSLSLSGNATKRVNREVLMVQVYPAHRQPPAKIGDASFVYR